MDFVIVICVVLANFFFFTAGSYCVYKLYLAFRNELNKGMNYVNLRIDLISKKLAEKGM